MSDTDKLKGLCDDWEEYNSLLGDTKWRESMQRSLIIEMRAEVDRLARFIKMDRPTRPGHKRGHGQ